ncbi:serine hydrolase domain-containing protein [Foetidibacter luteolus]|uniref:serine hydrolase domain-containing protein n=1 Tax=Foetidibacter luteolus TaxID=2608880 RepID=UPI001A98918D|nr:serine hydrolase domain-containing protein [Foetidibacter luteolus]
MKILSGTLLALVLFITAPAQTLDRSKLDQLFDRLVERNKGMGSIAIARDGKVLYTRSFGYGRVTETVKEPLKVDTRYRISSITKMYTAVMIFQLVEEGKLSLNDTLDKFFSQIPNAHKITIAQILSHRSGIPNVAPDGSGMQPRTQAERVAEIAKGQPDFEPDARHLYSNSGYVLLGYIVEKVAGKSYQEVLKDRITSRLGLQNTYLGTGNTNVARNESLSYRYLGEWKEAKEPDFSITAGAGAIVSTPADMVKFIQGLFDLKLVSQSSLRLMTTLRDGEGMGMESFTFDGKILYGHTGGSGTSGAWLAYYPEQKLAMAYTTNAKVFPVKDIVSGVFDIYWNRPFEIPSFNALKLSPEILDRYTGIYTAPDAPVKWKVTRTDSTLFIQQDGGGAIPLEATTESEFTITTGVTVQFDAAKKQMRIRRPQGERVFTKEN